MIEAAKELSTGVTTVSSSVRTKYKKLRFTWRDLLAFFAGAALITGVVLLNVYLGATI